MLTAPCCSRAEKEEETIFCHEYKKKIKKNPKLRTTIIILDDQKLQTTVIIFDSPKLQL